MYKIVITWATFSNKEGKPNVLLINHNAFNNEEWMQACPAQDQNLESSPRKSISFNGQGTRNTKYSVTNRPQLMYRYIALLAIPTNPHQEPISVIVSICLQPWNYLSDNLLQKGSESRPKLDYSDHICSLNISIWIASMYMSLSFTRVQLMKGMIQMRPLLTWLAKNW